VARRLRHRMIQVQHHSPPRRWILSRLVHDGIENASGTASLDYSSRHPNASTRARVPLRHSMAGPPRRCRDRKLRRQQGPGDYSGTETSRLSSLCLPTSQIAPIHLTASATAVPREISHRHWKRGKRELHSDGVFQMSLPTGQYEQDALNPVITPTIAYGKGSGNFDVQGTLGISLPGTTPSNTAFTRGFGPRRKLISPIIARARMAATRSCI
jgi:hypothetical protein